MSTKNMALALVFALGIWALPAATRSAEPAATGAAKAKLRVGTFDSRAVAIAYARSKPFGQQIRQMQEEKKKAEAAGDRKQVEQLDAKGRSLQEQAHLQGFGTASVANILENIKDQIPAIARQAAVDLIVSKWDIAYQDPGAEFVDVTGQMIKPFDPDERTLRIVKEMERVAPVSLDELKKHKDH